MTKIAVVTGAARGIGRAIALALRAEGYGVLAIDRTFGDAVELGEGICPVELNITADDAPAFVRERARALGEVGILVNNAGIGRSKSVGDTDDAELDRYIGVNLRAPFLIAREILSLMNEGASIVNIASVSGLRGTRNSAPYALTKAGLIGLTTQMAADYGPLGIRVNAVAPGLVETDLNADRLRDDDRFRRLWIDRTPFRRSGTAQDIANAVVFLTSQKASFINGHTLVVDGGWSSTHYVPE